MPNECLRQTHLTCVWLCRFGRKPLFVLCGITMAIMQVWPLNQLWSVLTFARPHIIGRTPPMTVP